LTSKEENDSSVPPQGGDRAQIALPGIQGAAPKGHYMRKTPEVNE
jgi:hypothetical protein